MAVWHVDQSGNNGNAGTSFGAALLTIHEAVSRASSGDEIICYTGTSQGTVDLNGLSNIWIRSFDINSKYRLEYGFSGARDQPGFKKQSGGGSVRITGLEITAEPNMPDIANYRGWYADLSALNSAHPSAAANSFAATGLNTSMRVYEWNGTAWADQGLLRSLFPTQYGILTNDVDGIIVEDCYMHHCGGSGFGGAYASYQIIRRNTCTYNANWEFLQTSGISIYSAIDGTKPLGWETDIHILIEDNRCYFNQTLVPDASGRYTDGNGIIMDDFRGDQQGNPAFTGDVVIRGNICAFNGGKGIHAFGSDNVQIYNNTCYKNLAALEGNWDLSSTTNPNISYINAAGGNCYNNISVADGSFPTAQSQPVQCFAAVYSAADAAAHGDNVFTHNLAYTVGGSQAEVSRFDYPFDNPGEYLIPPNRPTGNPFFEDAENLDFRLTASSPARGAGIGGEDLGAIPYTVGGNPLPVAAFTATPTSGTAPLLVAVDGSGSSDDGSIVSWGWNWGDGTAAGSGETASHTYTAAGTYTLVLTVTDNLGATDTETATIIVSEAESPTQYNLLVLGGKLVVINSKSIIA